MKKKTHKVPPEKIREHSPHKASAPGTLTDIGCDVAVSVTDVTQPQPQFNPDFSLCFYSVDYFGFLPAEFASVSTVSRAQRLPFPAFPLRASLPPLAASAGAVQAAAPPAEYHSDSAESLEEIPVPLAKLGSSSSAAAAAAADATTSFCGGVSGFPLPSPRPRTKSRPPSSRQHKSASELRFEVASAHAPVVFVSQASGEDPRGCRRQHPGPRPTSRASLGPLGTLRMEL